MNQPLSQKVVIVTGASSGVGEAAAEAFARGCPRRSCRTLGGQD